MWEIGTFGGIPYSYINMNNIQQHIKYRRFLPFFFNLASFLKASKFINSSFFL